MTEYWLISAPGDKTCQQTWETMNNLTSKQNSLSSNYKFHIPDLKVGTLDQLVGLSDDLGKLDAFVEQVTRKVAAYLGEVLEDQRDKLHENLMANNSQTSMDDENSISGSVGPANPLSTPVTPSSQKINKDKRHDDDDDDNNHHHHHHHYHCQHHHNNQRKEWKKLDQDAASLLGQHQHHNHQQNPFHNHNHNYHNLNIEKLLSTCHGVNSKVRGKNPNDLSINTSYYQVHHWCATTASSSSSYLTSATTTSTPTTTSPCPSFSSECNSSDDDDDDDNCDVTTKLTTGGAKLKRNLRCKSTKMPSNYFKSMANGQLLSDHLQTQQHHKQQQQLDEMTIVNNEVYHDDNLDNNDEQDEDDDDCGNPPNPGDLPTYITRFQWDMAKYPIKQSLRNIADIISKQVGQIDADLKTKSTTYNNLKGSLQNLEKKQTGSLLTRNLADLVKKEHFILDSEYLSTLLVIVPKSSFQEWHSIYEKLTDMIVPRSTQLITQDSEYGLFTVTLFKKVVEEFKLHAREKKFIVRDFIYNEEELAAGKNEITKLVTDKKKQFGPLVRWLKVNFSECFCAWIHVKALRVFVESVLRYGLPVNFQAILLHPHKKSSKRLRDVLNQLYAHLDSSAGGHSGNQDSVDIPGLGFGQNDYFPYVYYKINVDMVDNKV
ncbi:hypothetical protein PV325_010445 [Microctonus aethiopoides]|nr:hypothetical protein PV325_010445 [Microctonus aethiopoides]